MHTTSFDDLVPDLENKYGTKAYHHYSLLIEIQYQDREKVQIATTHVLADNFLLAKIVPNQQSHYVVMDNQDMDRLMKYVDAELTTWEWARRDI